MPSAFTVVSTATSAVGIGTTSPDYTLDVRGDANIDGNLTIKDNTVPSYGDCLVDFNK